MKQRVTVLGDSLPHLIKTLLQFASPDNLKCACQILKVVIIFIFKLDFYIFFNLLTFS